MNDRLRFRARLIAYAASIGLVAGVAAWNSFFHQVSVALWGHQPVFLAYTVPLSVDGMLLVATLAMADDRASGREPRGWARFAFWLGASVSVAANVASTVVEHGWEWLSIGVAMWPPICLLVVVEIMARKGRALSPEKNPNRVMGGRKAHQTRQAKAATPRRAPRKRTPSAPAASRTPVQRIEELTTEAPISPAPAGR